MKYLSLLFIFVSTTVFAAKMSIETIRIEHRSPKEVLEVIKPLLSDGGTAQIFNRDLIVKDQPETITSLKKLIKHLDQRHQPLIVSISQSKQKPNDHTSSNLRSYQTSRESDRATHQLRINAGETAYIESGKSMPIAVFDEGHQYNAAHHSNAMTTASSVENQLNTTLPAAAGTTIMAPSNQNPLNTTNPLLVIAPPPPPAPPTTALVTAPATAGSNVTIGAQNTTSSLNAAQTFNGTEQSQGYAQQRVQKELKSGIYIQPNLSGKEVRLLVKTIKQTPHEQAKFNVAKEQPSYATSEMETTVMVPFGVWIPIGGNQMTLNQTEPWHHSTQDRLLESTQIWVRIDKIEMETR